MKRALTAIGIIGLVGAIGYLVYFWGNAQAGVSVKNLETVVVEKGDIVATVSATGNVAPIREVTLAFESGGEVAKILAEEGDKVEEGQSLVQLDTTELEEQVAQARASLMSNEARLEQTKAGPSPEDIASAKATLASAQASLEELKSGPKEEDIIMAKADLERARVALEQAQANYDRISWMPSASAMPQALNLQQASIDYQRALASYNLAAAGPSEAQLRSAEAQVAQAQAQLEKLVKSPTSEDLVMAQAQVDQARSSLNLALLKLKRATMVAPFSGVVAFIRTKEGELVNPGSPIIHLLDDSSYHIDLSLDEVDIAQVKEGQEASVKLDALPDWKIEGKVEYVSPSATVEAGIVTYTVRVAIDPTEAPLKVGMTAEATVITQRKEGVLVLPHRALQFERETGRPYAEKLDGDKVVAVEVEIGLRDEFNTEIVRGLEEGDVVIVRGVSSLQRLRQTMVFSSGGSP